MSETQLSSVKYISASGSGYSWLYVLAIFMYWTGVKQLHRVAYYGVLVTAIGVVMNLTKLYFIQHRPFELDGDIQMADDKCPKEYGNPSGHAMFATAFGGAIMLDIFTTLKTTGIQKVLIGLGYTIFFIIHGYCRFVIGVHALN